MQVIKIGEKTHMPKHLDGTPLTLADLPPTDTVRWVPRKKMEIIRAIQFGLLSIAEAAERYRLSNEELLNWREKYEQYGLAGLKTRNIQKYRK